MSSATRVVLRWKVGKASGSYEAVSPTSPPWSTRACPLTRYGAAMESHGKRLLAAAGKRELAEVVSLKGAK